MDGNVEQRPVFDRAMIEGLTEAVAAAAVAILRIGRGALDIRTKADASPVTGADVQSQALLVAAASRLMPGHRSWSPRRWRAFRRGPAIPSC